MAMSKKQKEEIVRDYKMAKNKSKQIGILADLNLCSRREIENVLAESGIELKKKKIAPVQRAENTEITQCEEECTEEGIEEMNIEPLEEEFEEIEEHRDTKEYLPVVVWDALTARVQELEREIKKISREKEEIEEYIFEHM